MKKLIHQLSGGLLRLASLLLLTILIVQCTGPEGPMGPRGFDGNDGLDGLNGLNGEAFAYSAIYDIEPAEWSGDADGYWTFLDVAEITDDIYYEGAVLVYRLIEIDPYSFNMLPYTYVDNALTVYMDFDAYVGGIDVLYKEIYEDVNDTFAPDELMTFKVVIIEGIPLAKLKTMVDISDYHAVSGILKIDQPGGAVNRF